MYAGCFRKRLNLINSRAVRERKKNTVAIMFYVSIKLPLKKKYNFDSSVQIFDLIWHFFGDRFIKMVHLTLPAINFYSRRTYVPKMCRYVRKNFRERFASNKILQYLYLLM